MLPLLLIYLFLGIITELILNMQYKLKAKKRAKALFTFLPFYLFTFNSHVAYQLFSAAVSSLALPAKLAYTLLAPLG